MMYFVKRIRAHIVIGGLIIFSILVTLFPRSFGLVVGLVIGLLIMVMEQFGLKMGNLGRDLGGWMGNWAIGFADIISRINLLRSIQMLGFFMMIIAGLVVIWRTRRTRNIKNDEMEKRSYISQD